jgi:hypothetical protein
MRVTNRMMARMPLPRMRGVQICAFTGTLEWAVKDSNLRPWD